MGRPAKIIQRGFTKTECDIIPCMNSVTPSVVSQAYVAGTVEIIPLSTAIIQVSIIIPHFYINRRANVDGLLECLRKQTYQGIEVLIIRQISPQGKAINLGIKAASGKIIVVLDDDSRMDQLDLIEKLVKALESDSKIGMAGASITSPVNLNAFQSSAAKQFPRFQMPVVTVLTDSDMPCHGCAAFPAEVFKKAGMEREDILRGLDADLRVRIRQAGYRVVLVPGTQVYHPFPENVRKFMKLFFRNGYGSAHIQTYHPEINYDTDESIDSSRFVAKRPFIYRIIRFPIRLLKSLIAFQWIRLLGYSVYLVGYIIGFVKFSILKLSGRTAKL